MEFLYSLHRLNVAISHARCVAAIVASPALLARGYSIREPAGPNKGREEIMVDRHLAGLFGPPQRRRDLS